jgi:CHAD domain-containing protein
MLKYEAYKTLRLQIEFMHNRMEFLESQCGSDNKIREDVQLVKSSLGHLLEDLQNVNVIEL